MKTKDVVAGLGEIGRPIQKLISENEFIVGFDLNKKLMNINKFQKNIDVPTKTLHICIPFTKSFHQNVITLYDKFSPKCLVIHSTIAPYTTKKLQNEFDMEDQKIKSMITALAGPNGAITNPEDVKKIKKMKLFISVNVREIKLIIIYLM